VFVHKVDVHKYLLDDILWPTQHGTPHGYSKLWEGIDSTFKYSSNKCHQNVWTENASLKKFSVTNIIPIGILPGLHELSDVCVQILVGQSDVRSWELNYFFYINWVTFTKLVSTTCDWMSPHHGILFIHSNINPLKPELNPICYLLALLGAHHFLHVKRIRVKLLTFRLLMSYIYGAPILDVSRSHTTTQHSR